MTSDRDYFMLRAREERKAVLRSTGEARRRHEEFASAYEMRLAFMDRGDAAAAPRAAAPSEEAAPVQHIIVAA